MTNNGLKNAARKAGRNPAAAAGFSMIELMVAMSVFLVIAGATLTLFRQQHVVRLTTSRTWRR